MKSRTLSKVFAVGLILAVPFAARAQELNLSRLDYESANRVHVRTGAEYAFVAGVGYGRVVSLLGRRLLLSGDVTMPWAGFDAHDYRVRIGALVPIVGENHWRLAGVVSPTLRGTKNEVGRMTSLGADLGLLGGFYARHWFVAADLGFDWAMTTHISHSDLYRATGYANARDGWYGNLGGNFRYGLQTGASFGRHDLVLRVGQLGEASGDAPIFPFYTTLTLDTRL